MSYRLSPGDSIEVSYYRKYDPSNQGYILDVGDALSIVVEDHPELSALTVVRPDGMISSPLLGDVKAGGLTPEDLRERLRAGYAGKIPAPLVTVFVTEAQAKLNEFFKTLMSGTGGATKALVVRPDGTLSFPLLGELNLADRTVDDVQRSLSERYRAIFRYIDVTVNVQTSTRQKVAVLGEVAHPGVFALAGDLTVPQVLALAGGFLETAQPKSVIVIRQGDGDRFTGIKLNLKGMEEGEYWGGLRLQPLDIIVVPKTRIARVDKFVDQYMRRMLPFNIGAGVFVRVGGC